MAAPWVLRQELAEHSIREVVHELRRLSPLRLGLCLLATLLSYLALSAQDLLALRALHVAMPARKAAVAGAGLAVLRCRPSALLVYRALYFLLPLLIAAGILAARELRRAEKKKSRS